VAAFLDSGQPLIVGASSMVAIPVAVCSPSLGVFVRGRFGAHSHSDRRLTFCNGGKPAQGGPPFYTNDPGTPGNLNWEINLGYMPFFYSDRSVSHVPDVDLNFGVGDRIQLTYESA
jgi:hypothetical protein